MDMTNTALITIDFINDIVHPDGKIPSCAAMVAERGVLKNVNKVIAWAHEKNIPVIHVKVGFHPGYMNCPIQSPVFGSASKAQALRLGSWGTEFHPELAVAEQDFVDIKSRVSIFYATQLESVLRAKQMRHLILAGVSSNMAVEMAVREAHDRDYQVTVLADCCAAANAVIHEQAMAGTMTRLSTVIQSNALPA